MRAFSIVKLTAASLLALTFCLGTESEADARGPLCSGNKVCVYRPDGFMGITCDIYVIYRGSNGHMYSYQWGSIGMCPD